MSEIMQEAERLKSMGWTFVVNSMRDGWVCSAIGKGLAYGHRVAATFEEAMKSAIEVAKSMPDDPAPVIADNREQLIKIIDEIYGKDRFESIQAVESDEAEPVSITIFVKAEDDSPEFLVDCEVKFWERIQVFPQFLRERLRITLVWP